MAASPSRSISLLDVARDAGPLPASARLRIALDVLEPIAAAAVASPVSVRREGSRNDIANVHVGVRGKAKLVGRGNRSGVQVLLWEILACRRVPTENVPPLSAVVDDLEDAVADVVDAAMAGKTPELTDARALVKALVIASAGSVGTNRDVARLVARAPASAAARETPPAPAPAAPLETPPTPIAKGEPVEVQPAPRNSQLLPPPSALAAPVEVATQSSTRPASSSIEPAPAPASSRHASAGEGDADDPMAAELDAVLSEELDRLAPHGWDNWQLTAPDGSAQPLEAVLPSTDELEMLDSDDLVLIDDPARPPVPKRAPPPPPPRAYADVLMIEPDGPTGAHLAGVLRRSGYNVEVENGAETGIVRACSLQPKCILCDDEFLDMPGETVAQRTRSNSPRACLAPFVFLISRARETDVRTRAGARDAWLEKPFSTDALLEVVARFAGVPQAKADSSMLPPVGDPVMDGSLSLISLRTLVSMLEFERRSGVLEVTSKERVATITFRAGRATRTRVLGRSVSASAAVETLLSWEGGRFTFKQATETTADRWASPDLARGQ